MAKISSINEVDALKDIFYSFFEMRDVRSKDSTSDKVLISMQLKEANLNPFYNMDVEG